MEFDVFHGVRNKSLVGCISFRKSMALERVADTQLLLLHDADVDASGGVFSSF